MTETTDTPGTGESSANTVTTETTENADTTVTIGSSDVPVILGYDRYRNIWELWPRLVGLMPRYDNQDTAVMATGRLVERLIIPELFREREGVELVPGPPLSKPGVVGPKPWMHARHDFTREDNGRVVEAKKVRSWDVWGDDGTDGVPADHLAQVMWQQAIVKPEAAQLGAWNVMDEKFRLYEIGYRDDLSERLVEGISNWYERHVIACEPPPIDATEECARNLALLYPGRKAKTWRNPEPEDLALAKDIFRLRAEIEERADQKTLLESELKVRIGDDYGVRGVARWNKSGRGRGRSFALLYQDNGG